jgi:uridine kinase
MDDAFSSRLIPTRLREMPASPRNPLVLGIAGCSGSGKTTLARELASQLGGTVFPLDLYYRDLSHLSPDERTRQNFDHPESLEHELFVEHIRQLRAGHSIQRPVYDFAAHSRVVGTFETVEPASVLVVEGILALHYGPLPSLYDFSVYVDAPNEVCLNRRIYRDMLERGRTEQSVRQQFAETAKPMADLYVLPSQSRATITVSGTESLDWSIERIFSALRTKGLI